MKACLDDPFVCYNDHDTLLILLVSYVLYFDKIWVNEFMKPSVHHFETLIVTFLIWFIVVFGNEELGNFFAFSAIQLIKFPVAELGMTLPLRAVIMLCS